MSLELVRWRDAHFNLDDQDDWPEDWLVETVGWVSDDGKFLRIESEHKPDDEARAITRVPHGMVVARLPLISKEA